jgi:O-antigen/teichoic acid export membrane protein
VVVVVIARYLGVEGFGHYSFVMAVAGVFQLLADMGVRNIVIRDLAVAPELVRDRLAVARTLLVILSLLSLGGIALVAWTIDLPLEVRQSLLLAGVAVMTTFYALGYSAVLRAFEHMDQDILGFVAHKALLLALVFAVSRTAWGLRGVFVATAIANAGLYLYYRTLVSRRHGVTRLSRDLGAAWALMAESFPLGVAEVVRRLAWQVDRLVLTALAGPVAVGLFSTAYKFLEAAKPLAENLTLPLFPVLSRLARDSRTAAFDTYARGLRILYALAVPAAVVLAVLAEPIVRLLFGPSYRPAATALALMAPVVVLMLPTSLYGFLFTALGLQRRYTACVTAALVTNLGLDLLLIPRWSYRGAAVATLAGESALFLAGAFVLHRLGGGWAPFALLWRPAVAAVAPIVLCGLVRDRGWALVAVGTAASLAGYVVALVALGAFTRAELAGAAQALRRGNASV